MTGLCEFAIVLHRVLSNVLLDELDLVARVRPADHKGTDLVVALPADAPCMR